MTISIPANDHGKIRVFAFAGTPSDPIKNKDPIAIGEIFGQVKLNMDFVDLVDISSIDDLGLLGLIEHGYGITPDAADVAALEPLTGWVVLIMSRATTGAEVTLIPSTALTHVTTLGEEATLVVHEPLESEAAKGTLEPPTKPAKSDARIGGMVATFALIVMFALVGLMIWIAG